MNCAVYIIVLKKVYRALVRSFGLVSGWTRYQRLDYNTVWITFKNYWVWIIKSSDIAMGSGVEKLLNWD